jgi:hypothetical protein
MGHDYIKYEGHHERFSDSDLWTLRHFFIEQARLIEAADSNKDTTALCQFFEAWNWLGPGMFVGTDFSEFVLSQRPRLELLFQLLQLAGDHIAEFGEIISVEYLNTHLRTPTFWFIRPQPTRGYLLGIGRICTLLS